MHETINTTHMKKLYLLNYFHLKRIFFIILLLGDSKSNY